jgi:PAS domain S-box-containing protein
MAASLIGAAAPAMTAADDKVNILLVDDQPSRLLSYEAVLAELGENLVLATSGTEALKRLMDDEFAVILLDVNMPGMDGFETANLIHQHPRFERTPIIFVTAVSVTDLDKMTGYKLGAIDYVHVPVIPEILRSKVAVLVELFRKRRQLEQLNRDLAAANEDLAKANEALQAEKARELERLNRNLELANRELASANVNLEAEIDERRRAEERLRFLAETIPSFVWTAAPDGSLTYINQRWLEYTGLTLDHDTAHWAALVVHPDDYERSVSLWRRHLASGEPYQNEARTRRHDGVYRWFMTRAVPWRDDSGAITSWFGITTDIHDQKELEERLREADRRKDEFLATLAHELRNPLAPLQNALHMCRNGQATPETVEHAHTIMERQLRQLVRLVDDLLDVSRITRGKLVLRKELVTLEAVALAATETVRPIVEAADHRFDLRLPDEPVVLDADPQRLAQVFSNLLNNACKYTEPGGRIALEARRSDDTLTVVVRDNGIGIAPEQLAGVFDLFVQVDTSLERARGGLGIGLTVVKRLVEMHSGTIEARSAGLGHGSEFVVRLPIAATTGVAVPRESLAAEPPPSGARRRVMVVDDNRDAADTLAFSLEMLGHEIKVVYEAEQVVDASQDFQPEIVFMDVGMPKLNGFEVARRIRAQDWGSDIVLVALTGWGQEEDRRRSREAGFDHHLVKPAEIDEIERLCETALRGSTA